MRSARPTRLRLLAVATPLALAAAVLAPAAAPGHAATRQTADRTASSTVTAAQSGLQPLRLPTLSSTSATVTLITGAQVTLRRTSNGKYTVTSSPGSAAGPGSTVSITAQGGPAGLKSLRAVPQQAERLIGSGRLDPGLFDVLYLLAHGDTGPAAVIRVDIQYAGRPGAAALRRAGHLPGAAVLASTAASGVVEYGVAAGHAAAFWSALTGGTAGLATGAERIWLAGHQTAAPASTSQTGQPQYPVTETITRTTGPIDDGACLDGFPGKTLLTGILCTPGAITLLGVAGPGVGRTYNSTLSCARVRNAKPNPVCLSTRLTFRVPVGVYEAGNSDFSMLTDNDLDHTLEQANAELDLPQITVSGPTAINLNANKLEPLTVNTPQPVADYGDNETLLSARTLPDGQYFATITQAARGNWWVLPTPPGNRATIGTYNLNLAVVLGRPPVTASVASPERLTLHPVYPSYSAAVSANTTPSPFPGRHTYTLAAAGEGTAAEFGKIDARGKLVMIRAIPNTDEFVTAWQIANAKKAGAAGLLVDSGYDQAGDPSPLPVYRANDAPLDLPYAEIDAGQAATLTALMARGAVRVSVDGYGQTPYVDYLEFNKQGSISGPLHYTVTGRQLHEIIDSYHMQSPGALGETALPSPPGTLISGGDAMVFDGPATLHEYYGPVSPDTVWNLAPSYPANYGPNLFTVFGRPGTSSVSWDDPPGALGAADVDPAVAQAQPGATLFYCAGCRQGNTLFPLFWMTEAAPGSLTDYVGMTPADIHLYNQAGKAIAPESFAGAATFPLPASRGSYRLAAHYGSTSTTWDFTSAAGTAGGLPPGVVCPAAELGLSGAPCGATPMVFLRYNAFTSLANTVTAPGVRELQVTAYHQEVGAPPITGLKLWISTNGGKSWQALHPAGHDGVFDARYRLPALAQTNGHLSIKAQAADGAGDSISQTIVNALNLSTPAR